MLALATFTTTMTLAVPIFAVMGITAIVILQANGIDLVTVPQNAFDTLDTFLLLAIPLYILAGNLMNRGGIGRRLIDVAIASLSWLRGGIGAGAVLACMFFSTMSGSSSATTAAVGKIMIPAMERRKYPKPFATAIVACGGELGAIIPPSLPMIAYGLVTNVSIGALFMAGILPGLLIGLSLIITICLVAAFKGFDEMERVSPREWLSGVYVAIKNSFWALLMPFIILGGIYSGTFTAVEASVVAVLYSFFVGTFIYREIKFKDFIEILNASATTTSIIMLIVAFAGLFGYALTIAQIPQILGSYITAIAHDWISFLLLANVILFVAGTFMEAAATILLLGPLLAPIAVSYGINPVHFGMIMIVNIAIGMVTPPVAVNLSIACQISGVRMDDLWRPLGLFLAVLTIDVLIISYVPMLSLALLN